MRIAVLSFGLALTAVSSSPAQPAPQPTIRPFFSTVVNGPAFYVSCRNETFAALSSSDTRWLSSLRLDGTILRDEGGRIGAGLSVTVPPGESWFGIVALPQSNTGYFPAGKFRAMSRQSRVVPLSEGRHTLAVRCGDAWSEDLEFYWEAERAHDPNREP